MAHISTLTAALLIGLSTTASGLVSPDVEAGMGSENGANFGGSISTQMMAIDDAVQATREDSSAMCFVVALPENYEQARAIRDSWTAARAYFDQSAHQVFFVRGEDAAYVMESSFINAAPAAIAFRNGRPYHSRTGAMSEGNLRSFIALSFDATAPTTNCPDQTAYLFDSMNELASVDQDATAAKGACSIMLNLHALIHGPYASSFSDSDMAAMNTIYNQSQLTLAALDMDDPSVMDQIDHARSMAMKTWNKRTNSTFGIGIWMDLAMVSGHESEVLAWVDEGLADPMQSGRVAESLGDYGQSVASLLRDSHRFEALAFTVGSPDQVSDELAAAGKLAEEIASIHGGETASSSDMIQRATHMAAAQHAALLLVGRESEAWQVAQLAEDFSGASVASAAICSAAIEAGVLGDRHAFLVRDLDQVADSELIQQMNMSFAVVPTDD